MSIVFVSGDFYENCFVQGSKDRELFSSRMGESPPPPGLVPILKYRFTQVGFRKITNKNLLQVE
jgi:hypothetical protein